jgi:hypothetical protein
MKRCPKCGETKPLTEFWKNRSTSDGVQAWCKPCWYETTKAQLTGPDRERALRWRRYTHLIRKYGITADQYDEMLAAQDGGCAICHTALDCIGRRLAVDHDADSGHVRGLLCSQCNRAIGQLAHDPERIRRAAEYLEAAAVV